MRRRGWAARALAAICFLALWGGGAYGARELGRAFPGVEARLTGAGVSRKWLRENCPQAGEGLTLAAAWTRGESVQVSGGSLGGATGLRPVAVYGDMRRAAPLTLLSGAFPAQDDGEGCLLDSESAKTLFHSEAATGQHVAIAGKTYAVRGVIKTYEPCALIRDENAVYENLAFDAADLSAAKADMEALFYARALPGDFAVVQSGLYARILRGLCCLPGALLLIALGAKSLRAQGRIAGLSALFLWAAAVCLIRAGFFWPQCFLPTKCADFGFWRALWESWRAQGKTLSLLTPLPGEVVYREGMLGCLHLLAGALLSALALAKGTPRRPGRE